MAVDAFSSGKREEPVASLFISRRAQTDSSERAGSHVVGVLFVSLYVGTELCTNMLVEVQIIAGQQVARR